MRILYGVQATGNGHITRARVLAPELKKQGLEVDYLFSGRAEDKYFNMDPFADYQTRRGLTFVLEKGRLHWRKTLQQLNLYRYWQDVKQLDLSVYDLVISDFEPITAWAARKQGVRSIGIAHQYAFVYPVPGHVRPGLMARMVNGFAPVDCSIGLHWHHFDQAILPPLIQPPSLKPTLDENKVLVYLAFNTPQQLTNVFSRWPDYQFYIYSDVTQPVDSGNIHIRPFSRDGFQQDLSSCAGVVCNSGFGLISEAVQYGKKVLTIPLRGQLEQLGNAQVLEDLAMATVMKAFDDQTISRWLASDNPVPKPYPNVASELARWVASGSQQPISELAAELWAGQNIAFASS